MYELHNFMGKNRKLKWGNEYGFANTVHFLFKTEGGEASSNLSSNPSVT